MRQMEAPLGICGGLARGDAFILPKELKLAPGSISHASAISDLMALRPGPVFWALTLSGNDGRDRAFSDPFDISAELPKELVVGELLFPRPPAHHAFVLSFRSGWRRAPSRSCRKRSSLVSRGAVLIHFDCHNGIAAWFPINLNQASSL